MSYTYTPITPMYNIYMTLPGNVKDSAEIKDLLQEQSSSVASSGDSPLRLRMVTPHELSPEKIGFLLQLAISNGEAEQVFALLNKFSTDYPGQKIPGIEKALHAAIQSGNSSVVAKLLTPQGSAAGVVPKIDDLKSALHSGNKDIIKMLAPCFNDLSLSDDIKKQIEKIKNPFRNHCRP